MAKKSLYILILGVVLCSVVFSYWGKTEDFTIAPRNLIITALNIVLLAMIYLREIDLSIIKRAIFPVIALFLVFTVISARQAANIGEAVYESFRALNRLVLLFCAVVTIQVDKRIFVKAMVILAAALGVYSLCSGSIVGTMGGRNQSAAAFLLLFWFCVYAAHHYEGDLRRAGIVTAMICLLLVFVLRTRSVWLALGASSISYFLAVRKRAAATAAAVIIAGAAVLILTPSTKKLLGTSSLLHRKNLFRQTLSMIADRPFGVGAGNWKIAIQGYSAQMDDEMRKKWTDTDIYFVRHHNDFMQMLAETGPGGLLYLEMFLLSLFYARRSRVIFAAIIAYMVFACFSFPHERPALSMFLTLLMAMAVISYHEKSKFTPPKWAVHATAAAVMLLLSAGMMVFICRYQATRQVRRIHQAVVNKQWKKVIAETQSYTRLANIDQATTPISYFRGLAYFKLGDMKRAVENYERAYFENPNHLKGLMNLGACLVRTGRKEEAEMCYAVVCSMYPDFKEGIRQLRIVRVLLGKPDVTYMDTH